MLLGAFKGVEGALMAVSAHEKPSASYLCLHPPAQSARRVKVANFTVGLQQIKFGHGKY